MFRWIYIVMTNLFNFDELQIIWRLIDPWGSSSGSRSISSRTLMMIIYFSHKTTTHLTFLSDFYSRECLLNDLKEVVLVVKRELVEEATIERAREERGENFQIRVNPMWQKGAAKIIFQEKEKCKQMSDMNLLFTSQISVIYKCVPLIIYVLYY